MSTSTLSAARRCELLAQAPAGDIVDLAERLLERFGTPEILIEPEVGLVMMEVREPVCEERFHLGEVVVTRAEVRLAEQIGWCMRMGTDRVAALAGAICDAIGQTDTPERALVDRLCQTVEEREARSEAAEWAELSTTEVRFEEMD